MDITPLLQISPETALTLFCTLAAIFTTRKVTVSSMLKKSGEILTHAGDYLASSNPEDLRAMFVDAQDVVELAKNLKIAEKYNGIIRSKANYPQNEAVG